MPSRHCLGLGERATNGSHGVDRTINKILSMSADRSGQNATVFINTAVSAAERGLWVNGGQRGGSCWNSDGYTGTHHAISCGPF